MEVQTYERAVERYMRSVYRAALNACRNRADAEDVTQITFEKLWKNKKDFEDEEHLRKWLLRVAVNESNSLLRTAWLRKRAPAEDMEQIPFSDTEKSELYEALERLTAKERELIHLYYYEGYSVREIHEIMEMSETAVQTRLYRARKKLKEVLGDDDE